MFGFGFTAGVMLLIFAVVTVGTGVAYWKMLSDRTRSGPTQDTKSRASSLPVTSPAARHIF
jgi:hypothetical protein